MKKLIIILFLFFFSLFTYKEKIQNAFIEKINLNIKKDEVGIVFLPFDDSRYLLLKTENHSVLFPVYGKKNPVKVLERFGEENPTYSYTDYVKGNKQVSNKMIVDHITIIKDNKNFVISMENINFCIYVEGSIKNCDYVYFANETLFSDDTIKLAFYDDNLSSSFENTLYDHWIDVYKIKENEFTLFTFHNDTYNVVKLPNYYFRLS